MLLGWMPILSLPYHIYPDLVQKSYTNIANKKGNSSEEIRSFVQERQLIITRATIARILECNNQGPVIDSKKGFTSPNNHWDLSYAMTRFDIKYQPCNSSKKASLECG
mgnify:CR=1 FL=1